MKGLNSIIAMLVVSQVSIAQESPLEKIVAEAMPPEVGDVKVMADLLRPTVGPQLSESWQLRNTLRAFVDKLSPTEECFTQVDPTGDPVVLKESCTYVNGEMNGKAGASMMRVNLAEGQLKYMNRGREIDPLGDGSKMSEQDALEGSLKLAAAVGIPRTEMSMQYATANALIATAAPSDKGDGDVDSKRMEIFSTIPRCMPVDGDAVKDCVPVFNSGLRVAMVDQARGPNASWFNAVWPDFKLSEADQALSREEVIDTTVALLLPAVQAATLDRLEMFIAYAQNGEIRGQENHQQCARDESDERDIEPGMPMSAPGVPDDVQLNREFVPALVVYAIPKAIDEDKIDPTQQSVSTGIPVISISLVGSSKSTEC